MTTRVLFLDSGKGWLMRSDRLAGLGLALVLNVCNALPSGQVRAAEAGKSIAFLTQRLHSKRWQVRYGLLGDLGGRDDETKRVLEVLAKDGNRAVANQALVRYLSQFLDVDKALFDPKVYSRGRHPLPNLPKENPRRALVDYCLGRKHIAPDPPFEDVDPRCPPIAVLDPAKIDRPEMHEPLTIVGMLGGAEDASALHPFLKSQNDYVALGAAKALIRLGDKPRATAALIELAQRDVLKHLHYVTEALYALRELKHSEFDRLVLGVLARVLKEEDVQPNWLNSFLFLAAGVKADVWE